MRYIVRGRVQGVAFRYNTVEEARRLGLRGWVRNRADGSLEVAARGPVEALGGLEAFLRRGPPGARVDEVSATEADAEADLEGFCVRG